MRVPDKDTSTWPSWWLSDREYASALIGLEHVRALGYVRNDPDSGWGIDFEGAWEWPCSHGERIIIALAWCLFNFGWALTQEEKSRAEGRPGPVTMANPSEAVGTLGDGWWAVYDEMIRVARGR
jgi:hypothetical protein